MCCFLDISVDSHESSVSAYSSLSLPVERKLLPLQPRWQRLLPAVCPAGPAHSHAAPAARSTSTSATPLIATIISIYWSCWNFLTGISEKCYTVCIYLYTMSLFQGISPIAVIHHLYVGFQV